jgi:amino acid adenylation domain-containing protein
MSEFTEVAVNLPPEQQAIRAKFFHPSGAFVEFGNEEVEQSIPDRFEKIVAEYPDRIAVKTANHVLTYAQLNATANRVARAILAERGPGKEPIALLFEQGIDVIAAIIGVLKVGKFFVPVDPSFPQERIKYLLENSQAGLLVTSDRNVGLAEKLASKTVASLNVTPIGQSFSSDNLGLSASPDDLAALLYTSGSTGEPKGVIQSHRTLLHATMRRTNAFQIRAEDRLMLLASGTYQAIMNILVSLLNGARLCPLNVKKEGTTQLVAWLIREEISVYHSSASLFREFVGAMNGTEDLSKIRVVRLASETVIKSDVESYRKHFSSDCTFANGLGSTETGMLVCYNIGKDTPIAADSVPLGYPLQDMEILLLDDDGKKVGFNHAGEIAVRSRYLSPGYWQRPDLTQAKFRPDPEGSDKRVYFTGDLGRMSQDGCVEHLGRKDFLVKVRGYRVETGEVETKLLRYPGIKEAAVIGQKKQSGESQLVAYIVRADEAVPSVSELRGFLKGKLPDYMIPSAFVVLDALPRTPNGKVDRKALPVPGHSRPELDTPFVAPRTAVEQDLAKIWVEVLSLNPVGIHDNFFDLGGHSLAATRVTSQIRDVFQVELPLRYLFETPTVAALADHIERARCSTNGRQVLAIQPVSRDRELPLSFAQQRLWFLEQLEPGSFAYNFLEGFRLKGRLNVEALERSFNEVIRRHEALRTLFKTADGQPVPVIIPSMTIKVLVVDLRKMVSDTERKSEVQRLATEERQRPFDLARGPLLRVTLLRLTENEHVLLRAIHHIAFDGWSVGILARELSALYNGFSNGEASPLSDLHIQYADFAHWQRERFQDEFLTTQLSYWKRQLSGIPPLLKLRTDRPRPAIQSFNGARQYFVLSKALSERVKGLSKRHRVTLFTTLLAAFQALLHRYTGQNDIVIGSPVAGRNQSETESLIGFFLNMLVLRADLSGNPTFEELLNRVREVCLEAYSHQDLPFEKLVEELQPDRDLSRTPLFQVMFAFQNTPRPALELASLTVGDFEVPGIARYDLHLFMEEQNELRGWVDYNTDLFNATTITRMLGHFQALLEGIVAHPEQRLSDLLILTEAERQQLLVEWNDTKRDYPTDKCIHQMFEAQVERTPDAVAVVCEDRQLTYRELDCRANQLAHYLSSLGVGPEVPVGICVERSLEMVVGLLAILKAGGAYVPLDPDYPTERLAYMLDDIQAPLLLTQRHLVQKLPAQQSKVISLDGDCEIIADESEENLSVPTTPENLAYVIYTSGSTGQPKGVQICHRSVTRLLNATGPMFGFDEHDVWTVFHSYAFDFSVWEIWGALLQGGRLVVVPLETAQSPAAFRDLLHRERVTVLNQTPSAMRQLLEVRPESSKSADGWNPRLIICGGEAFPRDLAGPLMESGAAVWNFYGPTEATVWATINPVTTTGSTSQSIPIGRPIADRQIYLLDQNLQPVPVGVPGELHIAGAGLARGYFKRPELTAEKFIPHPFSNESGARLYKTGDLACYLPDGNIEFLGRSDHQVKVRGFRIELGEIEVLLSQHPAVRDTVVLAREETPGDKRLVAYIVTAQAEAPPASDLREFLRHRLPDYTIPSSFVFLEALPLTPNGKVDRRALPAPDQSRPDLKEAFVAPRTEAEKVIAGIWSEVLKLDKVGIHDNFFNLGGHSLLATQVVSRVRKAFDVDVPLRAIFETPTLLGLAVQVAQTRAKKVPAEAMESMLADLESLSEEETERLLAQERSRKG